MPEAVCQHEPRALAVRGSQPPRPRATATEDRRRTRGDASRKAVLVHAMDIASVEGLDGVTIGRLATASGHSKSSIATLFGGKEGLQIAAVAAAAAFFGRPTKGVRRPRLDRG